MGARFFQSVLVEVEGNVLDHVYPKQVGNHNITLKTVFVLVVMVNVMSVVLIVGFYYLWNLVLLEGWKTLY
jgi:hypothetical protein